MRDISTRTIGRLLNRDGVELQRILDHACAHELVRRHEKSPGNVTYETLSKGHTYRQTYYQLLFTTNADALRSKSPIEGDLYRLLNRIHTHGPISTSLAKSWLIKETRPAKELVEFANALGLIEQVPSTLRFTRTPPGVAYEAGYRRVLMMLGYGTSAGPGSLVMQVRT